MADNGGNHAANGAVENGGDHALAVAVAAANGGDPDLDHAVAAANGPVGNGGNHAANGAVENGGNPAPAPAAVEDGGNPAPGLAVAADGGEAVAPALRNIPQEALYHVLLRLPVAEVARCRTQCRLWRDVPSTQAFREDHHHFDHGRSMPLFFFHLDHQAVPLDDQVRVNLRAVDIRGRTSLPVMRFSHLDPALPIVDPRVFRIEGSCDGILLLSYGARLYACNPCTRRWARLPPLHHLGDIVGFYVGGLAFQREYRVLYHRGHQDAGCRYWVFSLHFPEQEGRDIGRPADSEAVRLVLAGGVSPSCEMPPVMVDDFLHWLPQVHQDNSYVLMFNTIDELFRWIPPPMVQEGDRVVQVEGDQLLEINGRLAMTLVASRSVEVWLLYRAYGVEFWIWTYKIGLPEAAIRDHHGYDEQDELSAAVFVVSEERTVLIQCTHALLQCDAIGTVLQTYQLAGNCTVLSGYMLRESLILHAFLPLRPSDATDGDPPFFQAP
ncbi:uncharacterized protein LOC133917537 [Phragmites australis]|uniref:uncharacterized protein LOC133917537 n=1 Tax=Phragmites australis TaxID=29695 RepID=UPI002D765403|nr:uncharacterized protein LOC133917537 [Phragmites australis]